MAESLVKRAYIGIGSNLGDRLAYCTRALERIREVDGSVFAGCSDWYWTKPVGVQGQEWYLNGVAALDVEISPRQLLNHLLSIEKEMGRVRKGRWEPRIIDLDILLFGSDRIDESGLCVPHPRIHLRRFVLIPLIQLAPGLVHPSLGLTLAELLEGLSEDEQSVVPYEDR